MFLLVFVLLAGATSQDASVSIWFPVVSYKLEHDIGIQIFIV